MKIKLSKINSAARSFVALALIFVFSLSSLAQAGLSSGERKLAKSIKIPTIQRITNALSDDKLEGRGSLQRGGDMSSAYLADQMKAMGLKPLGDNGTYLQAVPLYETAFTDQTSVKINGESQVYGKDWSAGTLLADMAVNRPLVFVGHGVVSDEIGRNDLKDADLKGKIAVWDEGPPSGTSLEKWKEFTAKSPAIPLLLSRGAVGVIVLTNGRGLYQADFMVDQTGRRNIAPEEKAKARVPVPMLVMGSAATEKLFAGSGMTAKEAFAAEDRSDFRPKALPAKLDINLKATQTPGNAQNVIGYIEGSDPVLKKEAVVFTAHYDGFGLMRGMVYNAAADNAIGTAEMLSVAEAFSRMKVKPKRSLIFIAMTAEEYGLEGSKYYAAHPTWDITKIAANLNLDGIGTEIMGPVLNMVGFGADYSTLGTMFESVAKSYGIKPMADPIPEQGVFKRSDHYSFVQHGVPALMLVGSPVGTKEGFVEKFDAFEKAKYHLPTDDVYKDWYWGGAKTVSDMMAIIGLRISEQKEMPSWKSGNPFSNLKRGDFLKDE